jgi:hypothetical protein
MLGHKEHHSKKEETGNEGERANRKERNCLDDQHAKCEKHHGGFGLG